ncbi:MAG: hypothetical protein ABUL60_03680 [Myxococcales bacterium]
MAWSRVGLVAGGLTLVLAACGGDAAQGPKASCVAGAQIACACPDGESGSQVCREDGSGFGACTCERSAGGVDGGAPDDAVAGRSNAGSSSGGGSGGTGEAQGGKSPNAGGPGQAGDASDAGTAGDGGNAGAAGDGPTAPGLDFPEQPIFEAGVPANAPELFGDPEDFSAGDLCVLEPQLSAGTAPGAMFPSNWLRPRFRLAADGFDLFEIRLRSAAEKHELVVYTTKPTWYLPKPIWRGTAAAAAGGTVAVTVRALNVSSPGTPVGVSGSFSIAPVAATGSVVFDTDYGQGLTPDSSQHWGFSVQDEGVGKVLELPQLAWSGQLGEDGAELRGYFDYVPLPGFVNGQPRVITRHAVAPDGKSMIFTDDWPWAKVAAQLTNSVGAIPSYLGKGGIALLKMPWWGDQSMSAAHFKGGDRILLTSYGTAFRSGIPRTKPWQGLPFYDSDLNESDLIGEHRLAWIDLESSANIDVAVGSTPDYGVALEKRNADAAAAQGTAWDLIATGDTSVSDVSPRFDPAGERIVYVTTDDSPEGHPSSKATTADLHLVPYNDRSGGASTPLDGASDPDYFEYDPAFSSDGKLIAFTRAPGDGVDGPYRNRFGEVTVVPSTGGEPLALAANVPAACAADDLSQGLLNASAVFAPSAPTSGGKTYYFVIFSSARSYGDEFAEPFQLPPDGSAPDSLRSSSQLYMATIVVDNDSGVMRSFPAIYLWNQNRAAGNGIGIKRSNFSPSWSNAQLAPLTIPPVPN